MILTYKDVSTFQGENWHVLELRSEKTIEPTLRRLGSALPSIFRDDPVEIFVPVAKRDLDVFELSTQNCLFVRSTNFQSLLRLKTITGVVGLMTVGDTGQVSRVLTWPDSHVQSLIACAEENFCQQSSGIEVGSFVRLKDGQTRDLCGTVEVMGGGRAVVRIALKTKSILVETATSNLLNLSHVPQDRRVFFYGPLVDQLAEPSIIEEDLHLEDSAPPIQILDDRFAEPEPKRYSRHRTVTALVRKLILLENVNKPMEIAKRVVEELKQREIKAPKNWFIVHGIIKNLLMTEHFRQLDPKIKNYREVVHRYGADYKFCPQQIASLAPDLKIPLGTAREGNK